jgi:hypothetical protein
MVVNTANQPHLWSRAAMASLVTLPLAALLIAMGLGIWGLIAAVLCGEVVANSVIIRGLKRCGMNYRLDGGSLARLSLSAALAVAALLAFRDIQPTLVQVGVAAAASLLTFLLIAYVIKPFSAAERAAVNRLLTRPLFQW